jgi:hypothetical protein
MMQKLTQENLMRVPEDTGVYRVYAFNSKCKPIRIRRFAKADNSGLLYIGRTIKQNLRKRLYQFLATSSTSLKTQNHSGALKYKNSKTIRNYLGEHYLIFDYLVFQNPAKKEDDLLSDYANT